MVTQIYALISFLFLFSQFKHLNFKKEALHKHILVVSTLGFINIVVMIIMGSKILNSFSPNDEDLNFDRSETGPFLVFNGIISNNFLITFLQFGNQSRSYLATSQFSKISYSFIKFIKALEKYSKCFSIFLTSTFPCYFLITPLAFKSINDYRLVMITMFSAGFVYTVFLIAVSVLTMSVLKPQLIYIKVSNEKRMIVQPLSKSSLQRQNVIISRVLYQQKVIDGFTIVNGIFALALVVSNMPFQYIFHPLMQISLAIVETIIIVRPSLTSCKNAILKSNQRKIHSQTSKTITFS